MLQNRISKSRKLASLKSDSSRLLYTWMLSHLDKNGNFYADPIMVNNLIFTRLGKSSGAVNLLINDLVDRELIQIYSVNGDDYIHYPDFLDKQPYLRQDREGVTDIPTFTPDLVGSNDGLTPGEDKRSKEKISKEKAIAVFVIDYLNQKTRKDFTHKDSSLNPIIARLNEGATKEDCIRVIDNKLQDQYFIDNPKYLRPSTLFQVSKFEEYLNEKSKRVVTPSERAELRAEKGRN